jgi:glycopeptide antibiotics resistance protein
LKLKRAQIFALIWTAFIASSCLLPASVFKPFSFQNLLGLDKLIHLILYFVFVQLWGLSNKHLNLKKKIVILSLGIIYGILIEFLQSAMNNGRSFEVDDMIANTIGCILGVYLLTITKNKLPLLKKYLPFHQKGN